MQLRRTRDAARIDMLEEELAEVRIDRLKLANHSRPPSPHDAPQPLAFADAVQALDPGTLLLSYMVGESGTILFIAAPGQPLDVVLLSVGQPELSKNVDHVFRLIRESRLDASIGELRRRSLEIAARRLYDSLLAPAETRIEEADRVLLVPDGPLHRLPFGILMRPESDGGIGADTVDVYFAAWKPFHVALSVTAHAEIRKKQRSPARHRVVAFGDPDYSAVIDGDRVDASLRSAVRRGFFALGRLPYSGEEVREIARLYDLDDEDVFVGPEAREARLRDLQDDAAILHLAVHGYLDHKVPNESALVFTIENDLAKVGMSNGLLHVWELLEGDVRIDVDLVVLSSCSSALGGELGGEGLIGMTRAFHHAGARAVVAALWDVDDRFTLELMKRFHRHLKLGESTSDALRNAQRELMVFGDGGLGDASAPYSWAGFQVFGESSRIPRRP